VAQAEGQSGVAGGKGRDQRLRKIATPCRCWGMQTGRRGPAMSSSTASPAHHLTPQGRVTPARARTWKRPLGCRNHRWMAEDPKGLTLLPLFRDPAESATPRRQGRRPRPRTALAPQANAGQTDQARRRGRWPPRSQPQARPAPAWT